MKGSALFGQRLRTQPSRDYALAAIVPDLRRHAPEVMIHSQFDVSSYSKLRQMRMTSEVDVNTPTQSVEPWNPR